VVSTRGRLDIVKPRRSVPHIILNRQTPFTLLSVRDTAPTGMVGVPTNLSCASLCAQNGTIDMVASDHSPAHPDLKLLQEGDFLRAWGGIAGEIVFELDGFCVSRCAALRSFN